MSIINDILGPTPPKTVSARDASQAHALLYGEAVASLRKMIIEGEYPTGERLPEKTLCEQFGISRTPLREAMRVLATEGLVILTPNRGAKVSEVTVRDVDEMFPIMGMLEALAGELACKNITEDQPINKKKNSASFIVNL